MGAIVGSLLFVGYGASIIMFLPDYAELEFASDSSSDFLWTLMRVVMGILGVLVPLVSGRLVVSEHPRFAFVRVVALMTFAGIALFALIRGMRGATFGCSSIMRRDQAIR
jgi:bacteriorhodopsin